MGINSYQNLLILVEFLAVFGGCLAQNHPPSSFFVFGDSLVDAGNNNYITTLGKANFLPYGIDIGKATGRFTNARTIIDIIGEELGLNPKLPPYLDPTTIGDIILHGVNYASGGAGILNDTGRILGGRISMDAQVDNFANNRQDIISRIGAEAALKFLGKSLFSVTMGANDFITNYLTPISSSLVPPDMFIDLLISKYRTQLKRLYNYGARKIIVYSIPPIGCIPSQRDLNPLAGDSCVAFPNQLAKSFNNKVKSLVIELNSSLVGSIFVYPDAYNVTYDIMQNFQSYGFENSNSSCCRVAGRFGGLVPCLATSIVCPNRSKYMFWDPFHPTEATNLIIAKRFLNGDINDIYPINLRQLFQAS